MFLCSKIIQAIYEVKYIQGLPAEKPHETAKGSLLTSPLYADMAQIDRWIKQFGEECGMHNLSEEVFLVYVTYAARYVLNLFHLDHSNFARFIMDPVKMHFHI